MNGPETDLAAQPHDVVIIGAGPAGLTAAIYASRGGLDTLVLERRMAGGQVAMTEMIENFPGFPEGIGGFELMDLMKQQALRFGARLQEIQEVESVTPGTGGGPAHVVTSEGTYRGRAVIVAAGVDPQSLNCAGESQFMGRGVSFCATCDGAFFRNKTVAVVGGGNSAVEEALYLTKFADKVFIIHRRDRLRADYVYQERARQNPKIEFLWSAQLREVRGREKVASMLVEFTDKAETHEIAVDGIFMYVGQKPNTGFLRGLVDMDAAGFIKTGDTLETSVPGIFAAGDCRVNLLKQVVWAAAEGALAARAAERYVDEAGAAVTAAALAGEEEPPEACRL
jgi:thioredoxin reductase (NADPH)